MSQNTIHLKDIFTRGTFGLVQVGQTMEEVQEILGKPSGIFDSIYGAEDESNVKFLRYYGYEFWFTKQFDESGEYTLSAFQIRDYLYENGYEGSFKKGIVLDLWIFEFGLSITQIEKALDAEEMHYTKSREYDFTVLTFANNSKIYFIKPDHSDALHCEGWTYHPKD